MLRNPYLSKKLSRQGMIRDIEDLFSRFLILTAKNYNIMLLAAIICSSCRQLYVEEQITIMSFSNFFFIAAYYLLVTSIVKAYRMAKIYEKYQAIVEEKLVKFLENGDIRNPVRLYGITYFKFFLLIRATFCTVMETPVRTFLFTFLLTTSCQQLIFTGKVTYAAAAMAIPFIVLYVDMFSSVIAHIVNKHDPLRRRILGEEGGGTPLTPRPGPVRNFIRNMLKKAIQTMGGSKVLVPAVCAAVGSGVAMGTHQFYENRRHRGRLETENRRWATEKQGDLQFEKTSPQYQKTINHVAETGDFPKKKLKQN